MFTYSVALSGFFFVGDSGWQARLHFLDAGFVFVPILESVPVPVAILSVILDTVSWSVHKSAVHTQ